MDAEAANEGEDGTMAMVANAVAQDLFNKPFSQLTAEEWQVVVDVITGRRPYGESPKEEKGAKDPKLEPCVSQREC